MWGSLVGMAGCESENEALLRALGEGCLLNSECNEGLVCVFRRCHVPCETSEDCPVDDSGTNFRCVVGDKPTNVCLLDDEDVCERHSDCVPGQVCALDDRCRDGCGSDRDCVAGQVCRSAACVAPEELVEDQLVAAPGVTAVNRPCRYSSECPQDPDGRVLLCREGFCTVGCYEARDCPRFFRCSTADDPTTPGDCELIGTRGRLFCDPLDGPVACDCEAGPGTGTQVCNDVGSKLEDCVCPQP